MQGTKDTGEAGAGTQQGSHQKKKQAATEIPTVAN